MTGEPKIDASIKDIVLDRDLKKSLADELEKLNYAQSFMWLGIKFINDNVEKITALELSNELWGGKDASYCLKILKRFVQLNVLKSDRKDGKRIRYFAPHGDKKIFLEFQDVAMRVIKSAKEDLK